MKQGLKPAIKTKQNLFQGPKQLQDVVISQVQTLNQHIMQELAQNPSLALEEDYISPAEEFDEDPEGWNPDFDRPADELETGDWQSQTETEDDDLPDVAEALERIAEEECGEDGKHLEKALECIDVYRATGEMPKDADKWLSDSLTEIKKRYSESQTPFSSPTFQVKVSGDRVTAILTHSLADRLKVNSSVKGFDARASKFIEQRRNRFLTLTGIAHNVLEEIQGDFFRQSNIKDALLALLPLPLDKIQRLDIHSPVKIDKTYLSKLGKLLVESDLGTFPLALFWPEQAAVVRMWVRSAQESGISKPSDILAWMKKEIEIRRNNLAPSDQRRELLAAVLEVNSDDVRNAIKEINKNR